MKLFFGDTKLNDRDRAEEIMIFATSVDEARKLYYSQKEVSSFTNINEEPIKVIEKPEVIISEWS